MQAHPFGRLFLAIAALCASLNSGRVALAATAACAILGFFLLRQQRLLVRYIVLVSPFVFTSAVLWTLVLFDFGRPDPSATLTAIFDSSSRFVLLVRMLVTTSAIVLAFGTVPDGEFDMVLRKLGLPQGLAIIFASGLSLATTVRESFERSVVALRAQGLLGPSLGSKVRSLGKLIGLTWVSTLSTSLGRAESKWNGNAFLGAMRAHGTDVLSISRADTIIAAIIAGALVIVSVGL